MRLGTMMFALALLAGCAAAQSDQQHVTSGVNHSCPPPAHVSGATPAPKPIVLIVLENQDAEDVLKHSYFRDELPKLGALFINSYGVAHPSYPNYLALEGLR